MGRAKGVKQTGCVAAQRRERAVQRQTHKEAIVGGTIAADLPEPLVPELFQEIQATYWACLKGVPDPRAPGNTIYPLYLILHRILSGFFGGARCVGVLFPKQHRGSPATERRGWTLSRLPTLPAVYDVLRRIDWAAAQVALAPLWERLGFAPDWIMRRCLQDPKDLLEAFHRAEAERTQQQAAAWKAAQQAAEKAQGMSAAKALRQGRRVPKPPPVAAGRRAPSAPPPAAAAVAPETPSPSLASPRVPAPGASRQDLLLDGKVVRASYNTGCQERFVHVTRVQNDDNGGRQRFIIGAQATVLDRNGEWGAALSILETLTPVPEQPPGLISADAGLCVEDHAAWLTGRNFFYLFRIKGNAGGLFDRVQQWAAAARAARPNGDFYEACRVSGGQLHSRRLWRLPGLQFASFPGITEGFVIEKKVWIQKGPSQSCNTMLRATRAHPGRARRFWSGFSCIGIRRLACSV